MKKTILFSTILAALFAVPGRANVIVYNNGTVDTAFGLDLISGYDAVGDSITLQNNTPGLLLNFAQAEFFNIGAAGTFDATLQFFQTGSPVGLQIGTDYTVTGIDIDEFSYADVIFSLPNITLPDNVAFMLSAANLSPGVQLEVELYGPTPSIGSNTPGSAIGLNGSSYSVVDTAGIGGGNPFLLLQQTPEPGETALIGSGLLAMAAYLRRRRKTASSTAGRL
jgi:hypothetical protein